MATGKIFGLSWAVGGKHSRIREGRWQIVAEAPLRLPVNVCLSSVHCADTDDALDQLVPRILRQTRRLPAAAYLLVF